jgi:hypothetical protein
MAEDEPASLHDKGNTNAMTCVTKLRNNLTDGNLLDNNVSDIHLRLSILENILASKQKTLAVLTEKFASYAMMIKKLERYLQQKSKSVSNVLTNPTKQTQKKSKQLSLDTSPTVDLTEQKNKRLHKWKLAPLNTRDTINTRQDSTNTETPLFVVFEKPDCPSVEDTDYEPESSEDDELYSDKIGNNVTRQKRKRLLETETECTTSKKIIRNNSDQRRITLGNAGLQNQNVICYSNAIFQAIASCNHHTTLFQNFPTDNQRCFKLNYEFITLINSMTTQSESVDPRHFIKSFTDNYTEFKDEQCT